jgi:hypothetical protein
MTPILVLFALGSNANQAYLEICSAANPQQKFFNGSLAPKQFISTIDFLDASINSINSFNSLLKKEAYRIKITSFNNPTSSDMGLI